MERSRRGRTLHISDVERRAFRILGLLTGLLLVFGLIVSMGAVLIAAKSTSREYRIKAAFLSSFAKFVAWPESVFENDRSPIVIAVVGEDPFKSALDGLRGKAVGRRTIEVRRVERPKDALGAHLVFIAERETERLADILQAFEAAPVLTVGEAKEFTRLGGIVRFYQERNRIRFEINPDAAERVGLKLSSQLLKLARIVRDQPDR